VKPLLAELTRAHLTTEPAPGRYAFHDLLRAYASELLPAGDPDRPAALDRLYEHYVHTAHAADRLLNPHRDEIIPLPVRAGVTTQAPADRREAMSWFTVERQVLLHAIRQATAAGLDGHAWQLAFSLTSFLDLQGHWSDLATAQHAAIVAAQRLHDRSGEAQARRMLARAQMALGRHRDSDAELGLALRLFEEAGDLAGHGHTHVDLARARGQRGAYREALDHALRALDLYRKADHRVGQANVLNNIGWYHAHLGEYAQARTRCQEALTLFRQLADPLGQAAAWDSLGYVDEQLGRHGDAVAAYRHAVDLCRKLGDRFYEADTLSRLGDTHRAAGDHDAARTAWQEALAIFEELDHHDAELVRSKLV
jgi:tetratricopeptide (TPR) repeat protein